MSRPRDQIGGTFECQHHQCKECISCGFCREEKSWYIVSSLITNTSTCNVVKQFQSYINNVIADTNDVCTCCGLFIPFGMDTLPTKVHLELVLAIEAAIIVDDDLDCWGHTDNSSHFYNTSYGMIVEKQIPKFGSANCINVLPCQKYPDIFSDLTPVKEAFIARVQSVMSVIKLRPSGTDSTASYHQIQGHTIVLP